MQYCCAVHENQYDVLETPESTYVEVKELCKWYHDTIGYIIDMCRSNVYVRMSGKTFAEIEQQLVREEYIPILPNVQIGIKEGGEKNYLQIRRFPSSAWMIHYFMRHQYSFRKASSSTMMAKCFMTPFVQFFPFNPRVVVSTLTMLLDMKKFDFEFQCPILFIHLCEVEQLKYKQDAVTLTRAEEGKDISEETYKKDYGNSMNEHEYALFKLKMALINMKFFDIGSFRPTVHATLQAAEAYQQVMKLNKN